MCVVINKDKYKQIRRLRYRLQRLGDLELEYWLQAIASQLTVASVAQLQDIECLLANDVTTLQMKMRACPHITLEAIEILKE